MGKIVILLTSLFLPITIQADSYQNVLEDMRIALMDMKKLYSEQKIELKLLEEKIEKKSDTPQTFDAKIAQIEKTQEKVMADLRALNGLIQQTQNALRTLEGQMQQTNLRIDEVGKLKTTLDSISKAVGVSSRIHKVTSGDTLEKIARKYNTSIDRLKTVNGLSSNTILIGQELKIPQ